MRSLIVARWARWARWAVGLIALLRPERPGPAAVTANLAVTLLLFVGEREVKLWRKRHLGALLFLDFWTR